MFYLVKIICYCVIISSGKLQFSACISLTQEEYNIIASRPMKLVCNIGTTIANTVTIRSPDTVVVVLCEPTSTSPPIAASCSSSGVYTGAIDETANTVTVTTNILPGDVNGTWSCTYETSVASIVFPSPIPCLISENFDVNPSSTGNVTSTTAAFSLNATYSCINVDVTFKWILKAGTSSQKFTSISVSKDSTACTDSGTCTGVSAYTQTISSDSLFQFAKAQSLIGGYELSAEAHYSDGVTALKSHTIGYFEFSPNNQRSTVFMTETITTTTNYISVFSNTTLPMKSRIATPTHGISEILTPSNFISEIKTPNTFGKFSTRFFDSEISISTFISMSSENNLLMSNLLLSSFDSLAYFYISSSQTDYVYSFIETSFPENSDIKSNTLISIPDVLSETSLIITKLPAILLTGISNSIVKFYSTPLRTIAVKSFTNGLIDSSFEINNFIIYSTSSLIYHTRTTHLFTSYSSNSGIIPETESTNTESYFRRTETFWTNDQHVMSDTVRKATHSNTNIEFSTQTLRSMHTILRTDTVMPTADGIDVDTTMRIYSRVLQTHLPESTALMSSKQPFPSETSKYLSTTSLLDLTLRTSFFESSIYTYGKEDDIITTKRQNSLMPTSIYASTPRTAETRMLMSGYLQSSFYPTEKDFSSRATAYFVTTSQTTNSYLVSSTETNPSSVNSNIRTTDIMAFTTQSSVYTVQNNEMHTIINDSFIKTTVQLSDLDTAGVTSKSGWDSLTSYHSFSRITAVNSLITARSTIKSSYFSLLDNSESPKVLVSASVRDTSSAAFIPKTVHSNSNTKAGLRETTKNAIFITTVSVVAVFIITVSSIMLLKRVVLKKRNTTLQRKTDNASLSSDTQSVRKIFPEFPYMEGSIYPRFCSTISSTYMTSPYEQNWNKV